MNIGMWVAKFKLKDDEDIYSPLCVKFRIDFFAIPQAIYEKYKKINTILGGVISGSEENKKEFINELKKDRRVLSVDNHHDFVFIHAAHPISREGRAEIKIFYNPQYIRVKPTLVSSDGWEYWEVACLDRVELNKLLNSATKSYHAEIFSIKQEKIKSVTSLSFAPFLSEKQLEALKIAYNNGYYNYPRNKTLPELAKAIKKSYSTFQEHISKAENKLVDYFLKYR